MPLTPLTQRAKNRVREHCLEVSRRGYFRGQPAVLTRCTDAGCGWTGWFTDDEMDMTDPEHDDQA